MTKYRVNFETGASLTITVEAEDPDLALDKAYEGLPGGICAQCSGWGGQWDLDLGDWQALDEAPEVVEP